MVARSAAGNASDRRGMDRLAAKEATMTFRMGSTQCRQRTYVDWRFVFERPAECCCSIESAELNSGAGRYVACWACVAIKVFNVPKVT